MDPKPRGIGQIWQGLTPVQRLIGLGAAAAVIAVLGLSFGGGAKLEVAFVKLPDATGGDWSDSETLTTYAAGECNGKTSCSVNLWVRDPIKAAAVQVGYVCVTGEHRMPVTVLSVPVEKELAEAVLFCK